MQPGEPGVNAGRGLGDGGKKKKPAKKKKRNVKRGRGVERGAAAVLGFNLAS